MLRSHGLGRLMNPRRIPLTLGTAAGTAFAAALIGLANTPAARADTEPDPFQDLFGTTGINSWTPSADASLTAAVIAGLIAAAPNAYADTGNAGFLDGSTEALILGGTGIPTPSGGYLGTVDTLYLQPNGFDGTTIASTTLETGDQGPSVAQGETDLINQVDTMWNANDFSTTDPLTIFGYSQGAVIASLAEQQLAADGIPSDALRFVMIGDGASAEGGFLNTWGDTTTGKDILDLFGWGNLIDATTPDNLYPTDVYTITGDGFAQWDNGANLGGMFSTHLAYLGLTPEMINSATQATEGLTDYFTIAPPPDLLETLLTALGNL
jgi:hypothetical protein